MSEARAALLLSINPQHVDSILHGRKDLELRRRIPSASFPIRALIYSTFPTMAIVGECEISESSSEKPERGWEIAKNRAGVTREDFDRYFAGAKSAGLLSLANASKLARSIPLTELRSVLGLDPPQSYRYLTATQLSKIQLLVENTDPQ